jgi:hypothetical protein
MKKTTQAQAMRGFDTPEQAQDSATSPRIDTLQFRDRADNLSWKLDNLMELVNLSAAGADARRALGKIKASPHTGEEVQAILKTAAPWEELEEHAGDVLHYVACQLNEVNDEFTENLYSLARLSSPSEAAQAATQEGGAA